jgi:hypothetical protein
MIEVGDTWLFKVRGQEFGALVLRDENPDLSYLDQPGYAYIKEQYAAGEFYLMRIEVIAMDEYGEGVEGTNRAAGGFESWMSEDSARDEARTLAGEVASVMFGPTPRECLSEEAVDAARAFARYLNGYPDTMRKLDEWLDDTWGFERQ